jgi:Ni/Fe-hydrogenase 1 B-type cytochrome subunit
MKYTLQFRIWHWLNALVVLGLLATFFLRKTFLSWRTNSEIIVTKLADIGVEITSQQATVIAKAIRAGMWEWHIIFGYALAFLMIYRIVLFFFDSSKKESFSSLDIHHKIVRISYYVVYATLFVMSVSGLAIHFYQEIGISKEFAHDIKEIHELLAYVLVYFTPLHIIGVFVAENRGERGLVSTMISGKEN